MADASVKLGVSGISQFKSAMSEAAAAVKMTTAQLKQEEAQLKATGDKETYLQNKMSAMKTQIEQQTKYVNAAKEAYEKLIADGADPMSKAVTDMQEKYYSANAALITMTSSMKQLESGEEQATSSTENLSGSLAGIGKKMSLTQVIDGIDSITSALESAGKKAIEVGEKIWDTIMDTAKWADDTATQAVMYGVDVETYQKMVKVFDTEADITADAYFKAKQKVNKAINDGSKDQIDVFKALGISTTETTVYGSKWYERDTIVKEAEDVLWEAGEALKTKVESGELTQDMADSYAQALFGKSFSELKPLFDSYTQDTFTEAVEEQSNATKEAVENSAALNDSVTKLKENWQTFQVEILGSIAPELTKVTESLSGLVNRFTEFAQTEEGQELLQSMADAVGALFSDLTELDPDKAVEGLIGVFTNLKDTFSWIAENKEIVIGALEGIIGGWGALKISGTLMKLINFVNGVKGLTAMETASATTAGASAGTAWASGFAGAVTTVAPWLFGLLGFGAAGYAGKKMIDANMNDENLNAVYGGEEGEGNIIDTMSDEAAKAAKAYWDVYQNTGSEEAMAAREKLLEILTGEGYENSEQGVSLIEQIFDNLLNENDVDEQGAKLKERMEAAMEPVEVEIEPTVPEDAAEDIAKQVGDVKVNGTIYFTDSQGNIIGPEAFISRGVQTGGITGSTDSSGSGIDTFTDEQISAVQRMWDIVREDANAMTEADWDAYEGAFKENSELFDRVNALMDDLTTRINSEDDWQSQLTDLPDDFFKFAAEPELAEDAASQLAEQVGTVEVPAILKVSGIKLTGGIKMLNWNTDGEHANGLSYVPFDGYTAVLHKGESVVPAREVSSRSYNSNLYVESMYMNNGTDANGLAAAMAAATRRTMSGYGS